MRNARWLAVPSLLALSVFVAHSALAQSAPAAAPPPAAPPAPASTEAAAPVTSPPAPGSAATGPAAAPAPSSTAAEAAPPPAAPVATESTPMPPAEADASPDTTNESAAEADDTGHGMQFGARAAFGSSYRVVFRYEGSAYCDGPSPDVVKDQKFCGFGGVPALDLALSFAPLDSVEPYIWVRLGTDDEPQTNTDALTVAGAGVRIYTMATAPFKIFIEPALGIEFEGGGNNSFYREFDYGTDFLFRVGAGAQYDPIRYFGFYANIGLGLGVARGITSTLEYQGGVQLRAL